MKQAGVEIALAADIDADACRTYAINLGPQNLHRLNLSSINPLDLLERSNLDRNDLDMIVGGPPCQGFSSAGAKGWDDPRNSLLRSYVEIVTALKPTWFVMENVEGLLTAKDGFYIVEAVSRFLEAGYWVRAKKVYMEQYGIPQRRKRVLVVGNLEECRFDFPTPNHGQSGELPMFESPYGLSVLDAVGDLPEPTNSSRVHYTAPALNAYQQRLRRTDGKPILNHSIKRVNAVTQQRISHLGEGDTMKNLPEELQHPSYTRRAYRRVMDGTPTEKRGGAPSGVKRLYASAPCLTITSASPTEFVHPNQDRLLTPRECARIQSFPDWFEFDGSFSSVATQIGNAIPPLFMEALMKHITAIATWERGTCSRGKWLGIDATKSNGISPALSRTLDSLEELTYAYL